MKKPKVFSKPRILLILILIISTLAPTPAFYIEDYSKKYLAFVFIALATIVTTALSFIEANPTGKDQALNKQLVKCIQVDLIIGIIAIIFGISLYYGLEPKHILVKFFGIWRELQ